ncbi:MULTISPECIES: AraC family transcriptional regulator [unclassified Nocardioides]|uniref:AraC family transcriptional regulator n=1 Tax=unclassified Nocardioides TaxID=2615069 RepID=UPI0012E3E8EE|nr:MULTISPECIES: AraC family transcriptional regulator [unclassified Nocardioides]
MRHWELPRSATGVRHMVAAGLEHGIDPAVVLAGTDLVAADLERPAALVATWMEARVAGNLAGSVADPAAVGLRLGSRFHLSTYGVAGLALLSSPSLQAAMQFAKTYAPLMPALCQIRQSLRSGRATVEIDGSRLMDEARPLLLARDLSATLLAVREVIGSQLHLTSLDVSFNVTDLEIWQSTFGIAPRRGASRTAYTFACPWSTDPLPQSDTHVCESATAECHELLSARRASNTVANRVLDRLWSAAPDLPGIRELAAALLTTERTLRRRLAEEGTSFRKLSDHVRFSIAIDLLESGGASVQQVAGHLRYGDTSAFTHAFRRWAGVSPRAFRRGQS